MRLQRAGAALALAGLLAACGPRQSGQSAPPSSSPAPAPHFMAAVIPARVPAHAVAVRSGAEHGASPLEKAPGPASAPTSRPAANEAAPASAATAPASAASAATPADPAILSASALPAVVHEGDTVTWDVHTTRDVVAVEVHVQLASFTLQRDRPGHFGLAFHVPAGVSPLFHGTYSVELTARTSAGASAKRTLKLRFE